MLPSHAQRLGAWNALCLPKCSEIRFACGGGKLEIVTVLVRTIPLTHRGRAQNQAQQRWTCESARPSSYSGVVQKPSGGFRNQGYLLGGPYYKGIRLFKGLSSGSHLFVNPQRV